MPIHFPLPGRAIQISSDWAHTCALIEMEVSTRVACWGYNDYGQVGVNPGYSPAEVRLAPPMSWLPILGGPSSAP